MDQPHEDPVSIEHALPGLAIIRLNRPMRLNAMDVPSMRCLTEVLDAADADPQLRVLVLTGTGRGFCAGLDLKSVLDGQGNFRLDAGEAYRLQEVFAGAVLRLRASHKIVIAAVNGVAVGAGFGLALACDLRFCSTEASFHVGAVGVGLSAGECGISYHLPRIVGATRAFEWMLTGRAIPAQEAMSTGLVSDVVPAEALLERALQAGREILRHSPYSTSHTKRIMWTNVDAASLHAAVELENHTQVLALMTQDFAEAARAFAHKRDPVFRGR